MSKIIDEANLALLRRIIAADKAGVPLLVTFDEPKFPVETFDLHSYELTFLIEQKYVEYVDLETRNIRTPGGILSHETGFVRIGAPISGKVKPTGLGNYVSENRERDDTRYKETRRISVLALIISAVSLIVSCVAIFK